MPRTRLADGEATLAAAEPDPGMRLAPPLTPLYLGFGCHIPGGRVTGVDGDFLRWASREEATSADSEATANFCR